MQKQLCVEGSVILLTKRYAALHCHTFPPSFVTSPLSGPDNNLFSNAVSICSFVVINHVSTNGVFENYL